MKKEMNNKGFSLVELIIVIAIMAVLIGVLAPQYLKYVNNSKVSTDITNADQIATTINVAVSDSDTASLWNSTGGTGIAISKGTDVYNDGVRVVACPDCAHTPGSDWEVDFDLTNGVTKITLQGYQIWPDATDYQDQFKK
ncbi:MAG: prepilin-type N-terminal cleavage/methylation domain-containing protein [Roseburia sp.]|nr:prepilin-type N-terminal cleavage/methylation domain-containing protein [Roseburia sp.]